MAKVKALISFAGTELSMSQGETREISGEAATYWNRIGYVEIVSEQEPEKAPFSCLIKNRSPRGD